ncbi:MAG: hypothetical protein WCV93_02990 [Candidatus Shapirobacteria bacterium]|jgi:hypothetical protein
MPDQQQVLVSQYISLITQKSTLDSKLSKLEQEIAAFCRQNRRKTLKTPTHLLYVIQKLRTVFPSKRSPERQTLEAILKNYPKLSDFMVLETISLGQAYDKKALPQDLLAKLAPLATQKPYLKISLLKAKKK